MDLDQRPSSHPTEEILEEFALDRLPEALAAVVEEHLLICHECQDSVAEINRFVSSLRACAAELHPRQTRWRDAVCALPRLVMTKTNSATAVALAVLVLAILQPSPPPGTPPAGVSLSSMRGSDLLSQAPAGKPLRLSMEAPGIPPGRGPFQVQIVDAAGNTIWKGTAAPVGDKITALPPKPLVRGVYWVRLYAGNSELLQEFGLAAK